MSEEHKIREIISLTWCFVSVHYIAYVAYNVALWNTSGIKVYQKCIGKRKHLGDKPYTNCHRFININPTQ